MTSVPSNPWDESLAPGETLLPAHVYAARRDWHGYYRALAHLPARDTLCKALSLFDSNPESMPARLAVDLGCGDGRDTVELLRRGWRVLAIDSSEEGLERLRKRNDLEHPERLETRLANMAEVELPPCDLVCASFSLPFCSPDEFTRVWAQIRMSLRSGGRFAGQLFGDRDDWAGLSDRTHHSEDEARALFKGFEIEMWQTEERESAVDPINHPKHWHVYHIVARRQP
jgi:tellurite methyltransferase